jgi:hypothetical protein
VPWNGAPASADEIITRSGGTNILKDRKISINTFSGGGHAKTDNSSEGNTPGGPALDPTPPPGVEAEKGPDELCECGCCDGVEDEEDEPRNIGSIAAAVDACGSFMELDGTLVTAIKAISMRCGAAERRVKELEEKKGGVPDMPNIPPPPPRQASLPTEERLVIDIPVDLHKKLHSIADAAELSVETVVTAMLVNYILENCQY